MNSGWSLLFGVVLLANVAESVGQPVIVCPAKSRTYSVGSTARLCVTARGTPPLTYQWVKDSPPVVIAGATNATLVLTNVQLSDSGLFRVIVTNASGSVTSAPVRLSVEPRPSINRLKNSFGPPAAASRSRELLHAVGLFRIILPKFSKYDVRRGWADRGPFQSTPNTTFEKRAQVSRGKPAILQRLFACRALGCCEPRKNSCNLSVRIPL